jgi:hypothetical protein
VLHRLELVDGLGVSAGQVQPWRSWRAVSQLHGRLRMSAARGHLGLVL